MQEDLKKIHHASMQLLSDCGIKILHPEILALIQKKGIKVNGDTVYFTEDQLMSWVQKAPSSFKLYARNPEYNMLLGGDIVEFAPSYGSPSVIEESGRVRPALVRDFVDFVRLYQVSRYFKINGGVVVQPTDIVSIKSRPVMAYLTIVNSDKCLMTGTGDPIETRTILEMAALAFGGQEELIKKPRVMTIINMNSPLILDTGMLENMIEYVKYGQPVVIASCTMAGSTGPLTLAGTLALSNAEILTGIAVAQMLKEGTPVVYGNQTTTADMKTGNIAIGAPEGALCYCNSARLAKMYGLPCRGGGALSDAKSVSVQSGYESMLTLLATAQAGTNLIIHGAGILDSYNSMSYEQFAVDLEIIGMVKRFIDGISVNDKSLAMKVIKEVGIGGHFLGHPHTIENCRKEPYLPEISLRGRVMKNPDEALAKSIHRKVETMLAEFNKPELPASLDRKLVDFLTERGFDPRPFLK